MNTKILIVDDNKTFLESLTRALRHRYDIVAAEGPTQGLDALNSGDAFAVVMSDLAMPGMDGIAFLAKARDISPLSARIMLTGHGDLDAAMSAVNEGQVFRFLTKPCPTEALISAIDAGCEQYCLMTAEKELLRKTLEGVRLKEDVELIMRHDLKSPLASIITLPQVLLMAGNLDAHQRDMLKCIEDAGYTVLAMVNLSTALFKMERGGYKLHPEDVNLVPIIRKIFDSHMDTANHRGLSLELLIDGSPAPQECAFSIRGEELLCYSMLANLVTNAVEASPDGCRVVVDMKKGGKTCSVSIRNQGAVPEAVRSHFFEKYVTAGKPRGTGLGTYSALLIAKAHGGSITMSTSEAEGTEVRLVLPAA